MPVSPVGPRVWTVVISRYSLPLQRKTAARGGLDVGVYQQDPLTRVVEKYGEIGRQGGFSHPPWLNGRLVRSHCPPGRSCWKVYRVAGAWQALSLKRIARNSLSHRPPKEA